MITEQAVDSLTVEICGKQFEHRFKPLMGHGASNHQPTLDSITDPEEYAYEIPAMMRACEVLDMDGYSAAPFWGLVALMIERGKLAKRGLPRAYWSPDRTFIAMVPTKDRAEQYGENEMMLSWILPLTENKPALLRDLAACAEQIAPICDVPAGFLQLPHYDSVLASAARIGSLQSCYVEREVLLDTAGLAEMRGPRLARKRNGVKRYSKDRFVKVALTEADPQLGQTLLTSWSATKQLLSYEHEYSFLLTPRCVELLTHRPYSSVNFSGFALYDKEANSYAGACFSVECSSRTWTNIMRITDREQYQYLGDYLWSQEAKIWAATHPRASDGNTGEWQSPELLQFKQRYIESCGGTLQDLYYLVSTDAEAEQLQVCRDIRTHLDQNLNAPAQATAD